ncbi:MAG: hypothetical protein M3076_09605 [Actinomycetota bacterium]|nr:hypothetical protein [Actinomycetota bacterium]
MSNQRFGVAVPHRQSMVHSQSQPASVALTTQSRTETYHPPATPSGPSIDGCIYANRNTHLVHFHAPAERLTAAVLGAGPTGVVLADQVDNSVCDWLPLPSALAARGLRVLVFDYGNGDDSLEVQSAARFLRGQGVSRVVLMGASVGGAVVIDAGVHLHSAPAAVISLSAVPEATNYPFPADARRLRSPSFQIGSTGDPITQTGNDTRSLFRASPSPAKRRLLIPGEATHGTDLIGQGANSQVRNAIIEFIRAHALA